MILEGNKIELRSIEAGKKKKAQGWIANQDQTCPDHKKYRDATRFLETAV